MSARLTLAVARYVVSPVASFDDFAARQDAWIADAAAGGAQIAVLPEYLALQLEGALAPDERADPATTLVALQRYRVAWDTLFTGLAARHGVAIVAGSFLTEVGPRRFRNRCSVFLPDGGVVRQDKLHLTGFERGLGVIEPGDTLGVFDWRGLRLAVSICYDIEFPLTVRRQYEAGARIWLVPSCTDTAAGAERVRVSCVARALENRGFVARAVTAGALPESAFLDVNTGVAAIHAPMDRGFPADGVLATSGDDARWAIAAVDVDALERHRCDAQVANDRDWSEQDRPSLRRATLQRPEQP